MAEQTVLEHRVAPAQRTQSWAALESSAKLIFAFGLLVHLWLRHRRYRAELLPLEADQLADVGITPEQIQAAVSRKFWQAPPRNVR